MLSRARQYCHRNLGREHRLEEREGFFFFSSRRRHTRLQGDWSSDVCSSDLARWLRLMIGCALLAMARTRGQPKERVLFLLDEFAHLGRMHPVQRDIGLAGGFGVTFWLIVQDLSQLKSTYGETWLTFLANIGVLQAFGINDWDTAEYLSKMTGEATIHVESEHHSRGVSRGSHAQRQLGAGRTRSEQGRRLLLPDEVRRLPREAELLFVKGDAPLLVERLNYLHDP